MLNSTRYSINIKKAMRKYIRAEFDGAIGNLNAAIRMVPKRTDAYFLRGLVKCELGQHADAIEDFDEARSRGMGTVGIVSDRFITQYLPVLYAACGIALCVLEQHTDAVTCLDYTINEKPDYGMAIYFSRANARNALGQHFAAIQDLDLVIRLKPECAAAYYSRAIAKYELGQYEDAIDDFGSALSNQSGWETPPPFGARWNVASGDGLFRLCGPFMEFTEEDVNFYRGEARVKLGEYYTATFSFNEAIRLNPDNVETHSKLGWVYLALGNTYAERAKLSFDQAIRLGAQDPNAYAGRGMARLELRQFAAAVADLRTAITQKPDFSKVHVALDEACNKLWRVVAASYYFDQAIRDNPDNAANYYYRARFNERVFPRQVDAAIADYDSTIRLDPDYAEAFYHRGKAMVNLGAYAKAKADFNEAIRLNPDNTDAHALLDLINKLATCDEAIQLKPDDTGNYSTRARLKIKLGQYAAAVADLDELIQRNPDDAEAYYRRGTAKMNESHINPRRENQQIKDAIADYDSVIRLQPENAETYYYRGKARAELRDYAAAIMDFDEAIRLEPNASDYYSNRGHSKRMLNQKKELAKTDALKDIASDLGKAVRLNPYKTASERARSLFCHGQLQCDDERYVDAIQTLYDSLEFAQKAGDAVAPRTDQCGIS